MLEAIELMSRLFLASLVIGTCVTVAGVFVFHSLGGATDGGRRPPSVSDGTNATPDPDLRLATPATAGKQLAPSESISSSGTKGTPEDGGSFARKMEHLRPLSEKQHDGMGGAPLVSISPALPIHGHGHKIDGLTDEDRTDLLSSDSAQCAVEEEAQGASTSSSRAQVARGDTPERSYYRTCMVARGWK